MEDYPLLNDPSLGLIILRAAERRPVTLEDCQEALDALFARIGERPPVTAAEIADRLDTLRHHLLAARLLEPAGDGATRITGRGRAVLDEHPAGIDDSVLMEFAEFRDFIRAAGRRRGYDAFAANLSAHDAGWVAQRTGQRLTDNPYASDGAGHLAWENGWSEARDEALAHAS